jgi:hypothetical protein
MTTTNQGLGEVAYDLAHQLLTSGLSAPQFTRFCRICRALGYRPEDIVDEVTEAQQ